MTASALPALPEDDFKLEVSEDGVHWRLFNPERDRGLILHRRMEFPPPREHLPGERLSGC